MNTVTLKIRRARTRGDARCHDCERLPVAATRSRVRQHVKQTGHTAEFVIEDLTVYIPQELS